MHVKERGMKLEKLKKQDLFLRAIRSTKESQENNVYPKPMSDTEFREIMIAYFLGNGWYIADPLLQEQVNTEAAYEIIKRYLGS